MLQLATTEDAEDVEDPVYATCLDVLDVLRGGEFG
jgi:hypothetical protein